jgi:hypothetical protein
LEIEELLEEASMLRNVLVTAALALPLAFGGPVSAQTPSPAKKPNILVTMSTIHEKGICQCQR